MQSDFVQTAIKQKTKGNILHLAYMEPLPVTSEIKQETAKNPIMCKVYKLKPIRSWIVDYKAMAVCTCGLRKSIYWRHTVHPIVVDAHSEWLLVFYTKTASTKTTIDLLQSLFSCTEIPECIVSDNGTPFIPKEL